MSRKLIIRKVKQPEIFQVCLPEHENDTSAESTSAESTQVQEFLYAVTEGYPMRHACAVAGIPYNAMITWLNPSNARYKPNLFKSFEKAKAMYYVKQIEKINRTRDWRAAAFWLERHEEEFAPKNKGVSVINQAAVGAAIKPKITLDEETIQALSEAYDEMHGRNKGSKIAMEKEE